MIFACIALFAAFANGGSLIPQGANVAPYYQALKALAVKIGYDGPMYTHGNATPNQPR